VDILAQKTRKFTQADGCIKISEMNTKECKQAIQQILAEIELRNRKKPFVQPK
jgi:hypothetical protein